MKTAIAIAAAMLFLLAACSTSESVKEPHPLLGQKIPETATTIAEPSETAPAATTALSLEEYPTEALADAEEKYVSALEYIATYYRPGRSAFHSLGFRLDVRDSELKTLQTLGRRHCAELKTEYEKQIFSAPWHDRYVLPTGWHPIWTEERQGCTLRGSAVSDLKVHEMSSDELCAYTQGTLESLFPGDIIKTEGSSDRMGVYPSCRSWIFTPSENLTHSLQTLEAKADAAASEEHRIRLWSFSRQITECRKNGDTGRLCSNIEPEYQDYIDSTKRQSSPGQPETVPATTNITTIIPFPEGFTNDPPEPTEIIPFPEDLADSSPTAETEIPTFTEETPATTAAELSFCQTLLADTIAQKEIEHPNYHFQNSEVFDASVPTDPEGNRLMLIPEERQNEWTGENGYNNLPLIPEQIKVCSLFLNAEHRDFHVCRKIETREEYQWYGETRYRTVTSYSPEGCLEARRDMPHRKYNFCGSGTDYFFQYETTGQTIADHPSEYEAAATWCVYILALQCNEWYDMGEEHRNSFWSEEEQNEMRTYPEERNEHCSAFPKDYATLLNWDRF